jgi:hypothetical protein
MPVHEQLEYLEEEVGINRASLQQILGTCPQLLAYSCNNAQHTCHDSFFLRAIWDGALRSQVYQTKYSRLLLFSYVITLEYESTHYMYSCILLSSFGLVPAPARFVYACMFVVSQTHAATRLTHTRAQWRSASSRGTDCWKGAA